VSHQPFEEAAALEAVGALEGGERQALVAHLRICSDCRAVLATYRQTAAALPLGLPPALPSPTLKTQLLGAFRNHFAAMAKGTVEAQAMRAKTRAAVKAERRWSLALLPPWVQPSLVAAAVALVLLTGAYVLSLRNQLATERLERQQLALSLQEATSHRATVQQQIADQEKAVAALRAELSTAEGDLKTLRDAIGARDAELLRLRPQVVEREREVGKLRALVAERNEMLTILRSAQVTVVSLGGLERAKTAGAFLLYDRGTQKAFFYAFNLPPLPPGKTYQLWAIVDKPVSAGTFQADVGQTGRLLIRSVPPLAQIKRFAVSVEPQGGVPQPTGDIYLVGQL
jgi:anti-sigma-K factor RskA